MSISYKPLWLLLVERNMNKSELSVKAKISMNAVAKMGKNEYVSLQTLEKICLELECKLEEVVQIEK